MSARSAVIDALRTIVDTVDGLESLQGRVVPASRDIGELDRRPALIVKSTDYGPTVQAPTRNVTWTGTVTLVSPHRDQERAEDQLEELLEILGLHLLTGQLIWRDAQLVNYDDQHLAYDITVSSIFQRA